MTTRFVGLKEFRANMAKISAQVLKNKQRLIVLRKNVPIFELRPIPRSDHSLDTFADAIRKGEEDIAAGRVYTLEEVERHLGLK